MPKCALFLWSVTALAQNSLSVSLKTAQTNSFFGAVDTYDSVEDSDLELSGGHAHSVPKMRRGLASKYFFLSLRALDLL